MKGVLYYIKLLFIQLLFKFQTKKNILSVVDNVDIFFKIRDRID